MPKRHYSKKIAVRIEALLADDFVKMDKWAFNTFLPSLSEQYSRKGSITDNQYQHLVRLEEKFSDENKETLARDVKEKADKLAQERAKWEKYYLAEVKDNATLIAGYYKSVNDANGTGYYSGVAQMVLEDKIPPERSCIKMLTNEYAKKVLHEWKKEPKYPVKSIVQPRKTVKADSAHPLYNVDFAFVVKVDTEAPLAVNGGKKYLVLPKGNLKGFVVCERDIKAYRKKK